MAVDPATRDIRVRIQKDGGEVAAASMYAYLTMYQPLGYTLLGVDTVGSKIGSGVPKGSFVPQLEKQTMWCYGHSYLGANLQNTVGCRYIDRLFARARAATLNNHALSGSDMNSAATRIIGNTAHTFPLGQKSFVWVDAMTGQLVRMGDYHMTDPVAIKSAEHGVRAILAGLSAETNYEDAAMTKVGSWTSAAATSWSGGTISYTSTTGDYAEQVVAVNATGKVDLFLVATAPGWALASGNFTIFVDGVAVATGTGLNQHYDTNASEHNGYTPMVVTLSGLTAGNHTIRIRRDATPGAISYLWVEKFTTRAVNPPPIFFAHVLPLQWAAFYVFFAGAPVNDADMAAMNQIADNVATEFPNVVTVDAAAGWDKYAMVGTDQLHPNDYGHAYLANVYEQLLAEYLPWCKGLHVGIN